MYELSISLKGDETENDRGYSNRPILAELTLEVDPERGWAIYQQALGRAVAGDAAISFRDQLLNTND